MRISVTQEDIDNGKPRCSSFCPVALAVEKRFEEGAVVRVDLAGEVSVWHPQDSSRDDYRLPLFVQSVVSAYDQTGHMPPFEFDLREAPID